MIDFQHTMEFQSQPSKYKLLRTCTIHSKSAREKYKAQLEKAKYGSRAEAIKHILWQCPPPPQVHTPSPYMRVDLFSFDDTFISSFYKPRKLPESPIRFFCRFVSTLLISSSRILDAAIVKSSLSEATLTQSSSLHIIKTVSFRVSSNGKLCF